jgi:hypothetical protein
MWNVGQHVDRSKWAIAYARQWSASGTGSPGLATSLLLFSLAISFQANNLNGLHTWWNRRPVAGRAWAC